jgi:formate dehydrogenase iron-sulfur subunit
MSKSFFNDTTKCTACRGCQVACKQWNKNAASKTVMLGSHQNPPDLDFNTFKLVRFTEAVQPEGGLRWNFFADQCRHCTEPPCKFVADTEIEDAIIIEPETGAVLFTEKTNDIQDFDAVRIACPYDIPRQDEKTKRMSKCTMCIDRVTNGLKPACVTSCPTGAMQFGDREEMIKVAKARLAEVQKISPKARLVDVDEVRVIVLVEDEPANYHDHLMASARPLRTTTRQELFAGLTKSIRGVLS